MSSSFHVKVREKITYADEHPAELAACDTQVRMHESMPDVLTAAEDVVELWAETRPAIEARTTAFLNIIFSLGALFCETTVVEKRGSGGGEEADELTLYRGD